MAQHTQFKSGRFISYKNGRRVLFGFVPLPVAVGLSALTAGVALAAVLLTTNITGTATVKTVGTANEVAVSASAVNGSALDCSNIKINEDFTTLTFNPVLTKTVNGSNSGTTPVKGGQCTITVKVKNTGTTPIRIDQSSGINVPEGWTKNDPTGTGFENIAPGAEGSVSQTIIATEAAADGGKFTGKLVYTDA